MNKRIHLSKFLSLIPRHHPERIGLDLDPAGWAQIKEVITKANRHGASLDRATLFSLVTESSKQRFEISPDGESISARYGHSIPVSLDLEPVKPSATLYHGTAQRFWHSIQQDGLKAKSRNEVYLSTIEKRPLRWAGAMENLSSCPSRRRRCILMGIVFKIHHRVFGL